MIVAASAIMAILLDEDDRVAITDALIDNPDRKLAGGSWVELAAVVTRSAGAGLADLAKETGEPLLFKGDDFRHTDVTSAMG